MTCRWIVLVWLLFPCVNAFGQSNTIKWATVIGSITSAKNGAPVTQGSVKIRGSLGGGADSLGHFVVRHLRPGQHKVEIRAPGYMLLDTVVTLSADDTLSLDILLRRECEVDAQVAADDIRENKPRLLLLSGIAGSHLTDEDKDFQAKYNIRYYDFGCIAPGGVCIEEYNKTIFTYLDERFGSDWRDDVREDVCFLKK